MTTLESTSQPLCNILAKLTLDDHGPQAPLTSCTQHLPRVRWWFPQTLTRVLGFSELELNAFQICVHHQGRLDPLRSLSHKFSKTEILPVPRSKIEGSPPVQKLLLVLYAHVSRYPITSTYNSKQSRRRSSLMISYTLKKKPVNCVLMKSAHIVLDP